MGSLQGPRQQAGTVPEQVTAKKNHPTSTLQFGFVLAFFFSFPTNRNTLNNFIIVRAIYADPADFNTY